MWGCIRSPGSGRYEVYAPLGEGTSEDGQATEAAQACIDRFEAARLGCFRCYPPLPRPRLMPRTRLSAWGRPKPELPCRLMQETQAGHGPLTRREAEHLNLHPEFLSPVPEIHAQRR